VASVAFREYTEEDLRRLDVTTLRRKKQEQLDYRDQATGMIAKIDANIAAIERMIDQKSSHR
jgi:hypothetical protein